MRILSLLPSATEIVYALGLEDQLVGVTHECNWPADASAKTIVSHSALTPGMTPAEIDRAVSVSVGTGEPIYRLDHDAIRRLKPDLVISQDLCAVCAVPSGHVNEALESLGCQAEVVSLDPTRLDDVLQCVRQVAKVTGTDERAELIVAELRRRLDAVRLAVAGLPRPRVFALEWGDPPFNGGHWVPEMIEAAGGDPVLAAAGSPSVRVSWEEIAGAQPDIVVFMPCGCNLDMAAREATATLLDRPELAGAAFIVTDADSYFSRPGPRLVEGIEHLAEALHPGAVGQGRSHVVAQLR